MGLREDIEGEIAFMADHVGGAIACRGVVERLSAILAKYPKPSGKTVRVRVAVATLADGQWRAAGNDELNDFDTKLAASFSHDETLHRYSFIEADVPLPEELVVEAEVV